MIVDSSRIFQLYLLSFMRVDRDALSDALSRLNSTDEELQAIRESMKGLGYQSIGGPRIEFYREMLGEPFSRQAIDNNGVPEFFRDSMMLRFKLSLWPEFDLVVNELPDGLTFDPSFRRSANVSMPELKSLADLKAWRFVREEVDSWRGPSRVGDAWDNWEEVDYMIPTTSGGTNQNCTLLFDFNLLQSVLIEDMKS